jgi:ABC-type transporter Mla subunit MlaD
MKEGTRNLLVGLFVILSLIVLGVLMVWFGETPSWLASSEWTLRIAGVQQLSGIDEGCPVYLNGVQIGRVGTLEFENANHPGQGVVILTRIKRQYSVPQGSFAKVYGATLGIGMGHIDVVVGPDRSAKPLDTELAEIRGEMHSIIGELVSREMVDSVERTIAHIGTLAEAAEPVANNLATLLEQRTVADVSQPGAAERGMTANIATVVERIDTLTAHLNEVLGDENVQKDVKEAVGDLRAAAEEFRQTAIQWNTETRRISDSVNSGLEETRSDLRQSFVALNEVLENLNNASRDAARVLHSAAAEDGTAGLLARDARLYEAAVLSLERLAELLASLQRITGKIERDGYITIGQTTPVGTFTKDFPIDGPEPPSRRPATE